MTMTGLKNSRLSTRKANLFKFLVILFLAAIAVLAFQPAEAQTVQPAGTWATTGSLNVARSRHTATLLPDGKVLAAGGMGQADGYITYPALSELYDPATGSWTINGYINFSRTNHTATLLPNGKVLVAGGQNGYGYLPSAELYDPATGSWTTTGSLHFGRDQHTATLLPTGKVLVTGGQNGSSSTSINSELYDPATGTWTDTGPLNFSRMQHTATLLPNGKVLVTGGWTLKGSFQMPM